MKRLIMYVRKENIPEENLDWDETHQKMAEPEIETENTESKHIIHPVIKNKVVLKKKINFSPVNIKRTIQNFFDE